MNTAYTKAFICDNCGKPAEISYPAHIGGHPGLHEVQLCHACNGSPPDLSTPQLKRMRLTLELQSRQDIVSIIEDAIYEFVSDNCPHCNTRHDAHDYVAEDDIHNWLKERMK